MTGGSLVRRVAAATAYGSGGVGLLGLGAYGLLKAEAKLARRLVGKPDETAPHADGVYGLDVAAPLSVAMLGDSIAAGVGTREPHETPGALLASWLSAIGDRPVRLTSVARSGARSTDLQAQVTAALDARPVLAVIIVGGNDVMRRVSPHAAVRDLEQAVRRLRSAGCEVVVGTCPDLGAVGPILQPLRNLAWRASRRLALAQKEAVECAGGRTASLALLRAAFQAAPREMFGPDRFHPSPRGYASAAATLLPSSCAALGLPTENEMLPDPERDGSVLPAHLTVEATEDLGTEVPAARVGGRDRGPWGRWVVVLHRRRQPAGQELAGQVVEPV